MAYKKKSKKNDPSYRRKSNSKHTPCERFLRFQYTHPGSAAGEESVYIDIAKELSKVNRRLYRQGMVYRVANISITSRDSTNALVSFGTAPDTWVTRAAWNRGLNLYNKMNDQVLDQPGSGNRKGRYHDYKVYLSDDMRQKGVGGVLKAIDNGNQQYKDGEWTYSRWSTPDGTPTHDLFWTGILGAHNGSAGSRAYVGLIQSYGESRASVHKESPIFDTDGDDDPLINIFDAGTHVDELADVVANDSDEPPYGVMNGSDEATIGDYYPGAGSNGSKPVVRRLAAVGQQGSSSAPTVMLPGFDTICGLIELEVQTDNPTPDAFDITIELAPGNYKGVAAFDI